MNIYSQLGSNLGPFYGYKSSHNFKNHHFFLSSRKLMPRYVIFLTSWKLIIKRWATSAALPFLHAPSALSLPFPLGISTNNTCLPSILPIYVNYMYFSCSFVSKLYNKLPCYPHKKLPWMQASEYFLDINTPNLLTH